MRIETTKENSLCFGLQGLASSLTSHENRISPDLIHADIAHLGLRDRIEINFTVIEEKCGSDLDDFSAESIFVHTSKEKSSRDESIFPSRTVKVIFIRSLRIEDLKVLVAPFLK